MLLDQPVKEPVRQTKRVKVSACPARDWLKVAPVWVKLADSSPDSSFFLSAEWISTWLETYGNTLQTEILVFEDEGGEAVGACLLVRSLERRGPFWVRRIYLNTGGGNPADRPMMEFNNLLCGAGWEAEIAEAIGVHLRSLPWDEFAIEGICQGPALTWLQATSVPQRPASIVLRPSFYVDLARLRQSRASYESSLSPNTREQLRRSLRLYSSVGEIRVEVAQELSRAEELLEEMCGMHQSRWKGRGEPGAFASATCLAFHRLLIRRAFAQGAIQILRASAGEETIGILYNFVHKGKVSFYQSGLNYTKDKHLKPGLVTHACAIQECLALGFDDYDFLAGDARYKRSLAKDSRHLAWVVFARSSLKLALIEFLRAVKRKVRG